MRAVPQRLRRLLDDLRGALRRGRLLRLERLPLDEGHHGVGQAVDPREVPRHRRVLPEDLDRHVRAARAVRAVDHAPLAPGELPLERVAVELLRHRERRVPVALRGPGERGHELLPLGGGEVLPVQEHRVERLEMGAVLQGVGRGRVGPQRLGLAGAQVEGFEEGDGLRHLPIERFPDRLDVGESALEGTRHQEQVFARDAHRYRVLYAAPRRRGRRNGARKRKRRGGVPAPAPFRPSVQPIWDICRTSRTPYCTSRTSPCT